MSITQEQMLERYRSAVEALLPIAKTDTSGGRAAAQVLLSTYNCHEFHLDPLDLVMLDPPLIKAAFEVLQLRIILGREPNTLVENGDEQFDQVWQRWEHLRNCNRYRKEG